LHCVCTSLQALCVFCVTLCIAFCHALYVLWIVRCLPFVSEAMVGVGFDQTQQCIYGE
jgi:hypothetical protein